jgi:threonylcarbamoyladenosine tRNA methylthiotransferase MtaB
MRVYLDQIGCRLNYAEMELLARRLHAVGHHTVDDPAQAQVIVFNSCAVTRDAGKAGRQRLRALHRLNPAARLVATGCWVTLEPEAARALPGVTLTVENAQKDALALLLEPWSAELDDPADLARLHPDGTPFGELMDGAEQTPRQARTRAFIKVQDGCNNRCTFCVVTLARGAAQSRPLREIVAEVQQLAAEGVQEAVLTGVHLGSYGRDLQSGRPVDLKTLTATLLAETGIPRLRLSSLEPWELADGFFDLWAHWPGRLCPHLHLPLQAGSDAQLRRMARRCTVASFGRLVEEARAAIPDLLITTDLIAGFPGESEADAAQGLAFVEEMRFADAHIFPYSAREGTAAAAFADQLPTAVKKARARALQAVVERTGQAERQRFVGGVRPVLWERAHSLWDAAPDVVNVPGVPQVWSGFTDNYLRVQLETPPGVDLHNQILPTRLEGLHAALIFGRLADQDGVNLEPRRV